MQQYHLSLLLLVKYYLRSLSKWQDPTGNFIDIFHHFKIIYTTRGPKEGKEEEITFFYCKEATLEWDLDWWKWVKDYHILNYSTKSSRYLVINKVYGMTRVVDKWQGHLPRNHKFYWS